MSLKPTKEFISSNFRTILSNPIKYRGFTPENGSEIYIREIPEDATIFDLESFFDEIGEVFQIRLMMKPNSIHNRGFGYVTYISKRLAQQAIEKLKNKLFLNSTYLKMEKSVNNCRIFLGGVPIDKSKDQIWSQIKWQCSAANIVDVITYKSYSNPLKNRGFVFLEFPTHQEASYFRAKFANNLILWGKQILVDWAIPMMESDSDDLADVKIIFMRHLPVAQTTDELNEFLCQFIHPFSIEKIFKFKDYAYVHLTTRIATEYLLEELQNFFKSSEVEIKLANPPNRFNSHSYRRKMLEHRHSFNNQNNQATTSDDEGNKQNFYDLMKYRKPQIHSNSPPSSSSSNSDCFNFNFQSRPNCFVDQVKSPLVNNQSSFMSFPYDNFDKEKCLNCNQFFNKSLKQNQSIAVTNECESAKSLCSSSSSPSVSPKDNQNSFFTTNDYSKLYSDKIFSDFATSDLFKMQNFDEKTDKEQNKDLFD